MVIFSALIAGILSGFRALTPLAAVSWGARLGILPVGDTYLAFLASKWTAWIFTLAALAELVNDKLPKTPSRKVPPQFAIRVVTGAISGAGIGALAGSLPAGLIAGAVGAVAGTLGGATLRGKLAHAFGKDLPAALLEDAVTVLGAYFLIRYLR